MNLKKKIYDILDREKKISVDKYINHCLYDDEFGYYKTKLAIGGKAGDFITAPEVTQIYGELIALFIINQWKKYPSEQIHIVELGAGLGTLMFDMIRTFKKFPSFFCNLSIHLVEINPILKIKQKKILNSYSFVHWYDDMNDVRQLNGFTFIVASEFFDALPIKQFILKDNKKIERHILLNEKGDLSFSQDGDIIEECFDYESVVGKIKNCVQHSFFSGMLIIDYGYVKRDFLKSTLQGIRDSSYESILSFQGDVDISHHVNFEKLQDILSSCFRYSFLTTQKDFLETLGIENRLQMLLKKANETQKMNLLSSCARLISPQHMGEFFKVLYASSHA